MNYFLNYVFKLLWYKCYWCHLVCMISVQCLQVFERLVDHIVLGASVPLPVRAEDEFNCTFGLFMFNKYIDDGMPDNIGEIYRLLDAGASHYYLDNSSMFGLLGRIVDERTGYIKYMVDNLKAELDGNKWRVEQMRDVFYDYCALRKITHPYARADKA